MRDREFRLGRRARSTSTSWRIPLGRIAEPVDVSNAVLFFASSASDFITGQTLYLDGRITATQ